MIRERPRQAAEREPRATKGAGHLGWFDGNPAHLWEHTPAERAKRYVEAIGGTDAVVDKARAAFDTGDYRWAAELLNHVVFAQPDHQGGRGLPELVTGADLATAGIEVSGDGSVLARLAAVLDPGDGNFAIVTP